MAFVPQSSIWEAGIYQLETTDPVEGGASGIANTQAKQLANRTLYLYNRCNDLENDIDNVADDLAEEILDRQQADAIMAALLPVKKGYIGGTNSSNGLNPGAGSAGSSVAQLGFTSCTVVTSAGDATTYLVTMPSISGTGSNYWVRMTLESRDDIESDHDMGAPVFKVLSATQFQVSIGRFAGGGAASIRCWIEIMKQ